ncbi:gas vesicle protein GvpG [Fictibacillus terranigra]|uniref:Gas vesicle protein GvpG n=1 Tax=Fictibacillus terranigra TaxID=3058424 RepID=A0ABT8E4X7_9BACL|nr:gas vesicle protein GvpG [Fictibacillus sp. CENA-BCM004]MDN4072968.1 gas vesicle protein GvpG [Fictibacillus sp. CENA-BCM004]
MIHKLFTAPMNLVFKVGEKVKEEADRELYDISNIQQKLVHLQMLYELDEIPEKLYREQEEELLIRYEAAKKREMEQWDNMTKQQI